MTFSERFEFGFLHEKIAFEDELIAIEPLSDYDRIYSELVTGGRRQVDLGYSRVWPSHVLVVKRPSEKNSKFGLASFVMHFLAYNFHTRLQFNDWYLDGSIPFMPNWSIAKGHDSWQKFLKLGIKTYKGIRHSTQGTSRARSTRLRRQVLNNGLYILCKSRSSCFEWERMHYVWMALDAFWSLTGLKEKGIAKPRKNKYKGMHFNRIYTLSKSLDVHLKFRSTRRDSKGRAWPSTAAIAWLCVQLRNESMHECLWAGLPPGHAAKSTLPFRAGFWFQRFVERVVAAMIVGKNDYSRSDWTFAQDQGLWIR